MNMSDKTERMTIRFNESEWSYITETSKALDITPSAFIRMTIDGLVATKSALERVVDRNVDGKTDKHDII